MIRENIPYFYGVVVLGPSGAGKTTFCKGLSQLLNELERPHIAINLDPANISGLDFVNCFKTLISLKLI
jgi:ABC-type phosphate/phosphonate transport system ATPase subunit